MRRMKLIFEVSLDDYLCYYSSSDRKRYAPAAKFTSGVFPYLYFNRTEHDEVGFDPQSFSEGLSKNFQIDLDYIHVVGQDVYVYFDKWSGNYTEPGTHMLFDYKELSRNTQKAYARTELLLQKTDVLERFRSDPLSFEYLDVRFDDRAFC